MLKWFSSMRDDSPFGSEGAGRKLAKSLLAEEPLDAAEALTGYLKRFALDRDTHSLGRIQGLLTVDTMFQPTVEKFRQDYLATSVQNEKLRSSLWATNYNLASNFVQAYASLVSVASKYARQSGVDCAGVFVRLFVHRESAYRLRLYRHEEWVPQTWIDIHKQFRAACDARLEAVGWGDLADGEGPAQPITAANEYLRLLLLKLCFSGGLDPVQVNELARHLREGSTRLALTLRPTVESGFYLDLTQPEGLRFRNKPLSGGHFLYLDTAPLCDRFRALLASAEQRLKSVTDETQRRDLNSQALIYRAAAARVDPEFKPLLRAAPRVSDRSRIVAAVGIRNVSSMVKQLKRGNGLTDSQVSAAADSEIHTFGFLRESTLHNIRDETSGGGRSRLQHWELRDRSDTGYRCIVYGDAPVNLELGELVGVNDENFTEWQISTVVRLMKIAAGRTEVGLKIISRQPLSVDVRRFRNAESGFSYNNDPVQKMGTVSHGLVLRSAFLDMPLVDPTIIIPRTEFELHARYQVVNDRAGQVVELGSILQEANNWVWTEYRVIRQS